MNQADQIIGRKFTGRARLLPSRAFAHQNEVGSAGASPSRTTRLGFTLLELLVALAMTAVLALALSSSIYIAFKAKKSAEEAINPIGNAESAMDLIRHEIDGIQPSRQTFCGAFEGVYSGSADGNDYLQFYSTADAPEHQSGTGEIKQVTILMDQPQGTSRFVLARQVQGNLLAPTLPQPDEEVLCRNVRQFRIRYWDGQQWQTSWDSTQYQNALPGAIELTLDIQPPGPSSGAQPPVTHLRRIFPLPCVAQSSTVTQANPAYNAASNSSTSGGTTGGVSGGIR